MYIYIYIYIYIITTEKKIYICTFFKSRQFKSRYNKYMIFLSIPEFYLFLSIPGFCFLKVVSQFP